MQGRHLTKTLLATQDSTNNPHQLRHRNNDWKSMRRIHKLPDKQLHLLPTETPQLLGGFPRSCDIKGPLRMNPTFHDFEN